MIDGNRPARAAAQSRVLAGLALVVVAFVAVALASGAAYVELEMPWRSIAVLVTACVIAAVYRLRGRA